MLGKISSRLDLHNSRFTFTTHDLLIFRIFCLAHSFFLFYDFCHHIQYLNSLCSDCRAVLIKDNDNAPSPEDEFTSIFDDELDTKRRNNNHNILSDDFKQYDSLLENIRIEKLSSKSPKKKEIVAKGIYCISQPYNLLVVIFSFNFCEGTIRTIILPII